MSPWSQAHEVAGAYDEDRWTRRYKHEKISVSETILLYHDIMPDCPCEPAPTRSVRRNKRQKRISDRAIRLSTVVDRWLGIVPTALLIGMYGACAFSLLAIGPVWAGFLAGFLPTSGLAAWAYSDALRW